MSRFKLFLSIFFITFSTVLIEILYTRIFSVIYISSFAFLMISLALFGYGLSGVFISLSKITEKKNAIKYLEVFLISYAIILPIIYKITLITNIDFIHLFNPITNLLILLINFIILLIPFFIAGVSLVLIFSIYSSEIGKLYFIDLLGAALGGVAIIALITIFGPSKIILLVSLIMSFSWFLLSKISRLKKSIIFFLIFISFFFMFKYSSKYFPVVPKMIKRAYLRNYFNNTIEHSKWSPINKIDVAPFLKKKKKVVWIDAGTMQSWLVKFNGNLKKLKPINWSHQAIPYQLTKNDSALIIGSSGGYEVLCALSHKFKRIIAVEMDPEICNIVRDTYSEYIGNIFSKKGVYLLNDEGRSVLKRLKNRKFDVIQMVNSHNSDALLSGGLSIAETYIYTVESFKDYWKHLNKDGFVSIVHWFGERLFSTAFEALREMKVENPEKKFFIIQAKKGFNFFFMKKGDITQKEAEILKGFAGSHEIMYSHYIKKNDNIYYKLASKDYIDIIKDSSVNIAPVRDTSPYFNQPNKIGQFKFSNNYVKGMAKNVIKWGLKYSNSVYLSILAISILFSIIFIYLPLRKKSKNKSIDYRFILYFFLIGISFIMVEIILIKIFELYLGNPAYSISLIIFSLLLSSGIGSFFSNKITLFSKKRTILYISIFIFSVLLIYSIFLFKVVYLLISLSLIQRFLVTIGLIFIVGFPMGVFFPTGIKSLGEKKNSMIGWAWGANSFATVLGSVLSVIISINWNFSCVMLIAAFSYLFAGLIFNKSLN